MTDDELRERAMSFDAYYYSLSGTGVDVIDALLSAIAAAGHSYHHTGDWAEVEADGQSPVSRIQAAADNAASALRDARRENARLEAEVAQLSTPDICGRNDDVYYEQDGWDAPDAYPNKVYQLDWANRILYGEWHLARVVTEWDEDGVPIEDDVQLFATRQAALDAVAASEAARLAATSPTVPTPGPSET